jgi:hypothetical protein
VELSSHSPICFTGWYLIKHRRNFKFYHHNTNTEPVRIPAAGSGGGVEGVGGGRALTLLHIGSWYLVMRVNVRTTGNFS